MKIFVAMNSRNASVVQIKRLTITLESLFNLSLLNIVLKKLLRKKR